MLSENNSKCGINKIPFDMLYVYTVRTCFIYTLDQWNYPQNFDWPFVAGEDRFFALLINLKTEIKENFNSIQFIN